MTPARGPGASLTGVRWALALGLVGAMFAAFWPALWNAFVDWDDDLNLISNPHYRGLSAAHLGWMFTTFHGGHYQPLSWLTLALDHSLWGMNPTGYHLTNLLLHAANGVLFTFLAAALLARVSAPATSEGRLALDAAALAGALFFVLHPLRVESVAWASERRDVLSACFFLITLLAYLRAQTGGGRAWMMASIGCFALSLLAKASGMALPLVLVAFDVYPLRRFETANRRNAALREKIPYLALAIGAAVLAWRGVAPIAATRTLAEHGVLARAAQAAYGLCFYLWKSLVPLDLSPLYLLETQLDPWRSRYVWSAAVVLGITVVLALLWRRTPWALLAWVCYVAIASPVLGLMQSGPQIVADRYTYLACLPWAVLAAAGVRRLWQARGSVLAVAVACVPLLLLAALTRRQTRVWESSRALWEHVIHLDPANYVAYTNRGGVREREGELEAAIADYTRAVRIHPGYALAYYNRGTARQKTGDLDGALADLGVAIELNPQDPQAWNNRGWARELKGDARGALADYAQALEVAPADFPGRTRIEENITFMRAFVAGRP